MADPQSAALTNLATTTKRESKEKTSDVPLREVKIRNTTIVVKETSLIIYFCYYIFDNI